MGNIYDYYAATDDGHALALFEDDRMDDPFGTLGLKGADPYLLLGTVEAHLTGVSEEQVEAGPRFCEPLNEAEHNVRPAGSRSGATRYARTFPGRTVHHPDRVVRHRDLVKRDVNYSKKQEK